MTRRLFYCRLPGGRVHIPLPEVIQQFCATPRYIECPVNRRWTAPGRSEPARERAEMRNAPPRA
jgi:hypothetical protein